MESYKSFFKENTTLHGSEDYYLLAEAEKSDTKATKTETT